MLLSQDYKRSEASDKIIAQRNTDVKDEKMKKLPLILIGLVVVLGLWLIIGYNSLVGKEEAVNNSWAQVETQLTRRADLIPNLVNTVKGYAKHESKVFEDIAKARSALLSAKSPNEALEANDRLSSGLGRLLAVAENYPNLKANEQFNKLSDSLEGTENRISFARNEYNNVIKGYNQSLRTFPTNILAGILGFQQKDYFKATEAEKKNPNVSFE